MNTFAQSGVPPISLSRSAEARVYALFAAALALTFVGIYFGVLYAAAILSSGVYLGLIVVELALVLTSVWWAKHTPLNYLMFGLFPLISGFTLTPYLVLVVSGYVNGASILLNAVSASACMALAAAVFARSTSWNLGTWGRGLFMGLVGLLLLGVLQIFVPALRTGTMELLFSGAGVLLFAAFTAYDLQRIRASAALGVSPFLLALSLYLDIYNLFLMVLRFMLTLSGNRR